MEFYVTATTLLQALCTEVTLDKYAYNGFVESLNPDKISVSHLGIGDALHTWHGTPDARCRAEGGSLTHVITSGDTTGHETLDARCYYCPLETYIVSMPSVMSVHDCHSLLIYSICLAHVNNLVPHQWWILKSPYIHG